MHEPEKQIDTRSSISGENGDSRQMIQKRGMLTDRITEKSTELLGYEISQVELRLMVYIQYVMTNEQNIDPRKINQSERKILQKWREAEYIEGGAGGLYITKEFWDAICELIYLGYVDLDEI